MFLLFLGTGGAWGLPEHTCRCATCRAMRDKGQQRLRSGLWLQTDAGGVLMDPGPDLRAQLMTHDLPRPDAVLITHEHGDHFLGLDELLCYRRALPKDQWRPIPVYAAEPTWAVVEARFGYLLPSLLQKHVIRPGQALEGGPFGPELSCVPVKTDHGPFPKGAMGYVLRAGGVSVGYTGDLVASEDPDAFGGLDHLVCQCAFLNEPEPNLAYHLSLQNAVPLLRRWNPANVYFVHFTCQDLTPGDDAANATIKRRKPADPLWGPGGTAYAVPADEAAWQRTVEAVMADNGIGCRAVAAVDGLRVEL